MFGLILLLLIVVPIVELYVLFQVADSFGWLTSILVLFAISALGGALMKWQTAGAFGRVTNKIRKGEMPSKELVDGALMIFGGASAAHTGLLHRRSRSCDVHTPAAGHSTRPHPQADKTAESPPFRQRPVKRSV